MLTRRLRSTICWASRKELLDQYERRYASNTALAAPFRKPHTRTLKFAVQPVTRDFSSTWPFRKEDGDLETVSSSSPSIPTSLNEGLEAIRRRPGMPQEGDVHETGFEWTNDRLSLLAARVLQKELHVSFESLQDDVLHGQRSEKDESTHVPTEGDSALEASNSENIVIADTRVEDIRAAGRSVEAIVREARQIHGDYLPDGVLTEGETTTYRRLYGDPDKQARVKQVIPEDVDQLETHDQRDQASELVEGEQEEDVGQITSEPGDVVVENQEAENIARDLGGEIRPYDSIGSKEEEISERAHPLTQSGRFRTSPSTQFLPQDTFVRPVQEILAGHSNKQLKEASERLFGGPGLPNSPLTPKIGRTLPQVPIPLNASQHTMGTMEANAYVATIWPSTYAAITSVLVESRKRLGSFWLRDLINKKGGPSVLDAGGGGVGILAWRDIVKAEWATLHSGSNSSLAAPEGKSTVLTGSDTLRVRAAGMLDNTTFLPRLPDYVHVRDRATLSDDRPAPQRKQFDVIIAPHTLWPLGEDWERKQQVQNLWSLLNPDGGVLLLIEKGVPRGFEVVAGAREHLLQRHIATTDSSTYETSLSGDSGPVRKDQGLIIAPCTNHSTCPMYPVPGVSRQRKDYCSFQQRYVRPPFLQRILGATERNHDDVDFSYIAVQKGRDLKNVSTTEIPIIQNQAVTDSAFKGYEDSSEPEQMAQISPFTLPRIIDQPIKRHGHVIIDLCTPAGKIDRWTVPRSFSSTAYRDARKSSWGDLWALGAKTRVPRNLRLGGKESKQSRTSEENMDRKSKKASQKIKKQREKDLDSRKASASANEGGDFNNWSQDEGFDADADAVIRQTERDDIERRQFFRQQNQIQKQEPISPKTSLQPSLQENKPSQTPSPAPEQFTPSNKPPPLPNSTSHNATPSPASSDYTPEQLALLRDFAAESRVDTLQMRDIEREREKSLRRQRLTGKISTGGRGRGRTGARKRPSARG